MPVHNIGSSRSVRWMISFSKRKKFAKNDDNDADFVGNVRILMIIMTIIPIMKSHPMKVIYGI